MRIKSVADSFDLERIVPYFQPVMDLEHNAVWSYECLARLCPEDEQPFLPSDFLMLVERQEWQGRLTEIMLQRSAAYFRDLNVNWSVNISQQDMVDPTFSKRLSELLQNYPDGHRISLELMASTALEYPEEFKSFLLLCKALDVQLFVDHFGAVTSNINSLLELPLDGIKVAGSLISQIPHDPEVRDFVSYLANQAKQQGVWVIAEHIEDEETLKAVRDVGIRFGQGFYFSYPQSKLN